jgi:hypothetical protein
MRRHGQPLTWWGVLALACAVIALVAVIYVAAMVPVI